MSIGNRKFVTLPVYQDTIDLMRVKTVSRVKKSGWFDISEFAQAGCKVGFTVDYIDGSVQHFGYVTDDESTAEVGAEQDRAFLVKALKKL